MQGLFVFELMDEWFKKNWNVLQIDLNRKAWHNALASEQFYGILATEVRRAVPASARGSLACSP